MSTDSVRPSGIHPVGERLYQLVRRMAPDDAQNGWLLLRLCAALGRAELPVWQLAENPGLDELLDVDDAPDAWIPLIARPVGARLTSGMSAAQQRAEIRSPATRRRGSYGAIAAAARRHMVPDGRLRIRPRYDPDLGLDVDAPGHTLLRVREDDVLDAELLAPAAQLAAPWWNVLHVEISDAVTYDDIHEQHATYDAAKLARPTYDDLRTSD